MLDEIEDLTNRYLDRQLDESQRLRLNELLTEEHLRCHFVKLCGLNYCLHQRVLSPETRRVALSTAAVHERLSPDPAPPQPYLQLAPKRSLADLLDTKLWLTAACLLVLVSLGALSLLIKSAEDTAPVVATSPSKPNKPLVKTSTLETLQADAPRGFAARVVSMSEDASWSAGKSPADFLMRLSVGDRLELASGMAKLELATKVYAVVSGPAEFEIVGSRSLLLHRGKLTGRSEEGDFTVQTPTAYVVDVGTAFGVSVDDQLATDVVVFEGEVHVGRTPVSEKKLRLTTGMAIRADESGMKNSSTKAAASSFNREFNGERPTSLGTNELSLVDIICGSEPNEYRSSGSIDPENGTWSTLPWSESKGVSGKSSNGQVVSVEWNPWVHCIFIPSHRTTNLTVSLDGLQVSTPPMSGGAWGPVWARRKLEPHLDPLFAEPAQDAEGFWGAGTTTALLDRSRWVRDGVVGLHANVGITIDLQAIRTQRDTNLKTFRGILAHLEQSHVSQPFHPEAQATFQVFVDGELRYERAAFCRLDGDAMFGIDLREEDRFMSLLVTDGGDGPIYDRVVLLDPILEMSNRKSSK